MKKIVIEIVMRGIIPWRSK